MYLDKKKVHWILFLESNQQQSGIGLNDIQASKRRQAIIWTNDEMMWCVYDRHSDSTNWHK